jgi:hypothetical protein
MSIFENKAHFFRLLKNALKHALAAFLYNCEWSKFVQWQKITEQGLT